MRPKIFPTLLVAAVALAACLFAAGAHAQRGGASRQANDNASGGARPKRVIVGRGSDTNKGSRVTITADDSLKDYSAYRSGDRFYVVLPKSAAGAARGGGGGKGYTDMQVQQRGDSVVLSYRVQPGAKPRVEQKFNRLDVVFDVPEGGQQSAQGQGDAGRQSQPTPTENRNASTAGQQQQSSQAQNASPQQNAAGANERRPTPAEARAQAEAARAQAEPTQANAGQSPVTAAPTPSDAAQGGTAAPSSTTEQPQDAATASASPSAEPQLAQAQAPAAVEPITTAQPAPNAQVAGTSLGTFLLRNWALALIFALVVVGLGLVIAARRTSTQAKTDGDAPDDAATPVLDAPRAKLDAPRTKPLAVASTTTTTSAATAKPVVTTQPAATATPATTAQPAATATPAATAQPVAAELDAVGEPSLDAAPIAAATALAGAAAASKSRKLSRKEARQEARRKKKGGGRDVSAPGVDETNVVGEVAESAAEEVVAESASAEVVAEPIAAETVPAVEPTPAAVEVAAEETPAVEELTTAVEVADVKGPAAEASTAEAVEVPAASSAAEVVSQPSEVAERSEVEEAELTPSNVVAPAVETLEAARAETETVEIAPAESEAVVESRQAVGLEPAVEREAIEETALEVAAVEAPQAEAEEAKPEAATAVSEIQPFTPASKVEPALAPDHETVQAETRRLLEGEEYDRAVVGTRDPVARQMVAAELLYVLAGRNEARRKRAGAAFVGQGFYDEAARDLREADAPAERAAAARSLALLGDRKATPLLVNALEDSSTEVRRAAVEALGSLRDPVAVEPLEALLERERNERNRIPGRVILNAVQTCREGSAEVTAEAPAPTAATPTATPAETSEAASAVETVEAVTAVEPAAVAGNSAAEEAVRAAESVTAVEPAPFVPGEEDAAPAAPLVEERGVEPVAEEDETPTVVAERPDADEGRAVGHDAHALAEDLRAAAESGSLEATAVEPLSAVETGIRPLFGHEEDAEEVTREVAAVPASEVGLEPRVRAEEESAQPALFDDDSAASARGIEPVADADSDEAQPSGAEVITGEWFDLDVNEFEGAGQPSAPDASAADFDAHAFEPAAHTSEPASHAAVFESSAGDAIGAHGAAESDTFVFELEPAAARDEETARGLDHVDVGEQVTAPLQPAAETRERARAFSPESAEKGIAPLDEFSAVPAAIQHRLASDDPAERAAAVVELSHVDTDEAFQQICVAFDDRSEQVRSAAARALYELRPERADSFTRALREANPERRREIGTSISASGLAGEAISQLTGESREKTYEAFSLLFLMAKAGEVAPLVRAIESHPSNEVRLAVVKLLALSGQKEILPAFRRLAVRGSLPTEVRSAVMEAIYQISSNQPTHA